VSYFAAALARDGRTWQAVEVDLAEFADLDAAVEYLREIGGEPGQVLLFVEEDDEWFGVVRVDGEVEPRLFVSDARVLEESELARRIFGEAGPLTTTEFDDADHDEDQDDESVRPGAEPLGDADLLADLGIPAPALLELSAEEGHLPADVIAALCERAGCLEEWERLRES
jgi:putative tRNA adenosine deaminase-associated protein